MSIVPTILFKGILDTLGLTDMKFNLLNKTTISINFLFNVQEDQDHIIIDIMIYQLDGIIEEDIFTCQKNI